MLSLSASLYLIVILGWTFTTLPERHSLTLPLLMTLHVFTGIASVGVTLAVGTIALKLAREDNATPFLGVAGIATNIGAGLGPMVGGLAADYFSSRSFAIQFSWSSPGEVFNLPVLTLSSFDFLFAIAFLVGSLSLNMLVALREEGEVQRDIALAGLTAQRGADGPCGVVRAGPQRRGGVFVRLPEAHPRRRRGHGGQRLPTCVVNAGRRGLGESASRGFHFVGELARSVGEAVDAAVEDVGDVTEHGLELARHATRSAIHGMSHHPGQVKDVSRGAVLGTIRSLAGQSVPARHSLRGAGYGAVQGAVEGGEDPGASAAAARRANWLRNSGLPVRKLRWRWSQGP